MSNEELPPEAVAKLLRLARLSVPAEEQTKIAAELSKIIGYVKALQEVDTTNVEPTAHVLLQQLAQREDTVAPGLERAAVLDQAPRHDDEGFRVPTFVEE